MIPVTGWPNVGGITPIRIFPVQLEWRKMSQLHYSDSKYRDFVSVTPDPKVFPSSSHLTPTLSAIIQVTKSITEEAEITIPPLTAVPGSEVSLGLDICQICIFSSLQ